MESSLKKYILLCLLLNGFCSQGVFAQDFDGVDWDFINSPENQEGLYLDSYIHENEGYCYERAKLHREQNFELYVKENWANARRDLPGRVSTADVRARAEIYANDLIKCIKVACQLACIEGTRIGPYQSFNDPLFGELKWVEEAIKVRCEVEIPRKKKKCR
jgi:hypothetical protein